MESGRIVLATTLDTVKNQNNGSVDGTLHKIGPRPAKEADKMMNLGNAVADFMNTIISKGHKPTHE